MGELNLKGNLNLTGTLALEDTILVNGVQALVELPALGDPVHGTAPLVLLPPPPAAPADEGTKVWVTNSFNKTVTAGGKPIVTQGMVLQGNKPTWPGMVLPSQQNATVKVNQLPICVAGDKAVILPSGASASLSTSGQ